MAFMCLGQNTLDIAIFLWKWDYTRPIPFPYFLAKIYVAYPVRDCICIHNLAVTVREPFPVS